MSTIDSSNNQLQVNPLELLEVDCARVRRHLRIINSIARRSEGEVVDVSNVVFAKFPAEQYTQNLRSVISKMPFRTSLVNGQTRLWQHNGEKYIKAIEGFWNLLFEYSSSINKATLNAFVTKISLSLDLFDAFVSRALKYDPAKTALTILDVQAFLRYELMELIASSSEGADLRLSVDQDSFNSLAILVDYGINVDDLLEALKEIITNGFKYGARKVEFGMGLEADSVVFTIKDDGLGMEEEFVDSLTQAVTDDTVELGTDARVNDSTRTGLRSSLKLFEKFEINSTVGEGTTIKLFKRANVVAEA